MDVNNLLSTEFSSAIQKAFDTETRRAHVINTTRAYYVYFDLKGGIPLGDIQEYRLEPFLSFLEKYVSSNNSDKLSKQLLKVCSNALSKISS